VNSHSATAIFVLSHYDAHGSVDTGTGRLLDVLNDQNTRYLKLENVRICPRAETHALVELASTVLIKNNIDLVVLLGEDRRSESKVFFASLARKTIDAVVTLPTILVEGRIHTKMANDPQAYLSLEAGAFFPLTAAKIQDDACEGGWLESPVILVNKEALSSISFK
jgi:hypothetical protein